MEGKKTNENHSGKKTLWKIVPHLTPGGGSPAKNQSGTEKPSQSSPPQGWGGTTTKQWSGVRLTGGFRRRGPSKAPPRGIGAIVRVRQSIDRRAPTDTNCCGLGVHAKMGHTQRRKGGIVAETNDTVQPYMYTTWTADLGSYSTGSVLVKSSVRMPSPNLVFKM